MAITVVGSPHAVQTATLNPTLSLGTVTATNTLLVLVIQKANTNPGIPTDDHGDVFVFLGEMTVQGGGISGAMYYCLRAAGGTTTLTLPTIATCSAVAVELAGVASPVLVNNSRGGQSVDPTTAPYYSVTVCDSTGQASGFCATTIQALGTKGNLVLALVTHLGTGTYVFSPTGWTNLGSGATLGMTYNARTISPAGQASLVPAWTVTPGGAGFVLGVSFPAA